MILGYGFPFVFLIGSCLFVGYYEIDRFQWIYISCPFAILTLFSYHILTFSVLATNLIFLLAIKFLIIRLSTVSKGILKNFKANQIKNTFFNNKNHLSKNKNHSQKLNRSIGRILVLFKETNALFSFLSLHFCNTLFGAFIFPSFLFVEFPVYFKILSMLLYSLSLGYFYFFLCIFNDSHFKEEV